MRLLDRYLLRELLTPLAMCLGGFLIFWVSFDLFNQLAVLQEHKLHGDEIVLYEILRTPEMLAVVLPVALLLALLYALTQHARHNEITAMRAAGISLWRLAAPYLGVGFAASVALFVVNEFVAPLGSTAAQKIFNRHMEVKVVAANASEPLVFNNARGGRVWGMDFYDEQKHVMRNVHVNWKQPDGSQLVLSAGAGWFSNRVWNFTNVQQHAIMPGNIFPVNRQFTNLLTKPEFTETPDQINGQLKIRRLSAKAHVEQAQIPLRDLFDYLRLNSELAGKERRWVLTQFHSRLASPWTCLVVVFLAIPFGAASGRRNVFVGVAGSIFICFAFFVLQQLGLAFGTGGQLWPWLGAWFPNLFFVAAGVVLASRVR